MEEIKSNEMDDDKPKGMSGERKIMLGLVAALLIVAAYMYGWKVSAVDAVERKLSQVETEQAESRDKLIKEATQLNDRRAEDTLRLFSIPFAWAIRRELMTGNLDRVDQYFGELVQIKGFRSAILARPDGKIIVASDRKKLVETFSSLYPAANLDSTQITLEKGENGKFRAMIPILGLNKHLGMVVLEYVPLS